MDLKKHYRGPQGEAARRIAASGKGRADAPVAGDPYDEPGLPESEQWSEFHRQIGQLAGEEREVIGLDLSP